MQPHPEPVVHYYAWLKATLDPQTKVDWHILAWMLITQVTAAKAQCRFGSQIHEGPACTG